MDKQAWTYGCEIEWGDIDRSVKIPVHLGRWNTFESTIVNMREPYKHIAIDPDGINPPVGGEINVRPTKTWHRQVDKVMELKELFVNAGTPPTASVMAALHVHVLIPGLGDSLEALIKLTKYIKDNQHDYVKAASQYREYPDMKNYKGAKAFFNSTWGRTMPDWMCDNIINFAGTPKDFIQLHALSRDMLVKTQPFRYAVNTYMLCHLGTVEFRAFRATVERHELESCLSFCEAFMDAALNDGPSVAHILASNNYTFPPFIWDAEAYDGWSKTQHKQNPDKKKRVLMEPSDD